MARTALLTGAAGFTGRAVLDEAAARGWVVHPLVRRSIGLPREIVADFEDPRFAQGVQDLPPVDVVIHLGARIGFDGAPLADLFVPNVLATGLLAAWAGRIGSALVFASAAVVCGVRAPHIGRDTPAHPDTAYGYSKWLGEEVIRAAGVDVAILRIAGVFGLNGPSHLGLNRSIGEVLQGIPPVLTGTGGGRRNYIYVHDLAEVIVHCAANRVTGVHCVAGSSVHTMAEMLQILCEEFLPGRPPQVQPGEPLQDQVVDHSPVLPAARPFREAMRDMHAKAQRLYRVG